MHTQSYEQHYSYTTTEGHQSSDYIGRHKQSNRASDYSDQKDGNGYKGLVQPAYQQPAEPFHTREKHCCCNNNARQEEEDRVPRFNPAST